MELLAAAKLSESMTRTQGTPQIKTVLGQGCVAMDIPTSIQAQTQAFPATRRNAGEHVTSVWCTCRITMTPMSVAARASKTPAICPDPHLLRRPLYAEQPIVDRQMPGASPVEPMRQRVGCMRITNEPNVDDKDVDLQTGSHLNPNKPTAVIPARPRNSPEWRCLG